MTNNGNLGGERGEGGGVIGGIMNNGSKSETPSIPSKAGNSSAMFLTIIRQEIFQDPYNLNPNSSHTQGTQHEENFKHHFGGHGRSGTLALICEDASRNFGV